VTVTQRLAGLDDVASGGFEPPDVQVAAGGGYVVELVNLAERIWRVGTGPAQELATEPLSALFGTSDQLTDPRILYDAPSGRWLASISDLDASAVRLAVSATGDPTGRWTVSSYSAGGCADQPHLGVADHLVVLGADIFPDCEAVGARSSGAELWIVNKDQLVDGSTAPATTTYGPNAQYTTLAPAQSLSPTAGDYVVSVDEPFSGVVHVLEVSGVPPGRVSVEEVGTPAIGRLTRPPFAAQPPASSGRVAPGIETNDSRVLDSVWDAGRLWFAANDSCVPAGDTLVHACGRIVELATPSLAVTSDSDLARAGADVFYPALRPDGNGDLVVVYGESSQRQKPETVVVARPAGGAFTPEAVVARSVAPYLGERYGDYFGAATDPSNPGTVWVAGEVGSDVASGHGWVTTIASVVVTPAGGTPPVAIAQAPPGVRAVAAVDRVGRSVQLGYRSLDDGADVRTVVTVREQTSGKQLVFNRTTAAGDLHAGRVYYVHWLPAKRLRGAFAYCVRTLATDGSTSPSSCATITLR
jgi:hypothetical protein